MRRRPLVLALSLLAFAAPAAPNPMDDAETALARHSDSFSLDDSPQGEAAMAAYWRVLTDAALGVLNGRPGAPAAALVKALPSGSSAPNFEATALGPDLIGLNVRFGEMGDVLLLARRRGRFVVAWDAARIAPRDVQRLPMLAAWALDHARQSCRSRMPGGSWDRCGPLFGSVLRLPPDRAGHVRFALEATYAQSAGETIAGQISLWSWDGVTATPLLARSYGYMMEQDAFVDLKGDILHVREKDEFKSFFSCGACQGRQVDWSLRIGPDGITDLGTRSVMPELDAVDAVIDAMRRGAPVRDLASDQVVRMLQPMLDAARDDARRSPDHVFSVGMLEAGLVLRHGDSAQLCFSTDDMEKPLLIALRPRNGGVFLVHAAVSASEICPA